MLSRRSSEASSCLIRFCTGTLSAARVRGVTVPVGARPWRAWKRITPSATTSSYGAGRLVGGEIAADQIRRLRSRSSCGPCDARCEFGVGGNRRPSAAHREIRITQRRFPDPLRGAFVEGRFMRQRQRRRRARFGGRCGGRLGGLRAHGLAPAGAACRLGRSGAGAGASACRCSRPNAGAVASIVAMATIVILRMVRCPCRMRPNGADVRSNEIRLLQPNATGPDLIRKSFRQIYADERCVLIKLYCGCCTAARP